jgi:hypothetical protein
MAPIGRLYAINSRSPQPQLVKKKHRTEFAGAKGVLEWRG